MKFWIDMDNSFHVRALRPLIAELERKVHCVEITARDRGHTLLLLTLFGLRAHPVGRHGGRNKVRKYVAFATQSLSLVAFAAGRHFDPAFSHGSRSLVPAGRMLGSPVIHTGNSEYTSLPRLQQSRISRLRVPDVIPLEVIVHAALNGHCLPRYQELREKPISGTPAPPYPFEKTLHRWMVLSRLRWEPLAVISSPPGNLCMCEMSVIGEVSRSANKTSPRGLK